jgi:hypothetical protein
MASNARGRGYYYHQVEDVAFDVLVGSTRVQPDGSQAFTPNMSNTEITVGQLLGKVNVSTDDDPVAVSPAGASKGFAMVQAGNVGQIPALMRLCAIQPCRYKGIWANTKFISSKLAKDNG